MNENIFNLKQPLEYIPEDTYLLCSPEIHKGCNEYIYAKTEYLRKMSGNVEKRVHEIGKDRLQELWKYAYNINGYSGPVYVDSIATTRTTERDFYKVLVEGMKYYGLYKEDIAPVAALNNSDYMQTNNYGLTSVEVREDDDMTNETIKNLNDELNNFLTEDLLEDTNESDEITEESVINEEDNTFNGVLEAYCTNTKEDNNLEDIIGIKETNLNAETKQFNVESTGDVSSAIKFDNSEATNSNIEVYNISENTSNDQININEETFIPQRHTIDSIDQLYPSVTTEEINNNIGLDFINNEIFKANNKVDENNIDDIDTIINSQNAHDASTGIIENLENTLVEYERNTKTLVEEHNSVENNITSVLFNNPSSSYIALDFVQECILNKDAIIEKAIEYNNRTLFKMIDDGMQSKIKESIMSKLTMETVKGLITEDFINHYRKEMLENEI